MKENRQGSNRGRGHAFLEKLEEAHMSGRAKWLHACVLGLSDGLMSSSAWSPVPASWPQASFLSGRYPPSRSGLTGDQPPTLLPPPSTGDGRTLSRITRSRTPPANPSTFGPSSPAIVGWPGRFLTAGVGQCDRLPDQSQRTGISSGVLNKIDAYFDSWPGRI
jgi:hypothetical protein